MLGKTDMKWKLAGYAVAALVTTMLFRPMLLHPGSVMLAAEGDAAKNYYTLLYHVLYGDGVWFTGMNYPYGEHIVFTDAQPLLAMLFAYINDTIPVNPLAIMNLCMVAGFFLGIVYVRKILLRFDVHPAPAIAAAVLIIIMSPQQFKLAGHFSLAYFCVLPVVFYYNLVWLQTKQAKYAWALFSATLVFTFIHLYFALMICLWLLQYSIGYMIFFRASFWQKIKHTAPVLLAGGMPVLLFQLFMQLTDPIGDRPAYPYGARAHGTSMQDIFTSYLSPVSVLFSRFLNPGKLSGGNEGYTYTGIVPLLVLAIVSVRWFFIAVRNKSLYMRTDDNHSTCIWLFVAAGMLLFGSAIIFVKCYACLDHASFIRQFRAIGRFSWGYYYIAAIISVVVLYRLMLALAARKKTIIAWVLTLVAGGTWIAEAAPFYKMTNKRVADARQQYEWLYNTSAEEWQQFLQEKGYNSDSFRAMYAIPYFHIGTEKLGLNAASYSLMRAAFSTSQQLGLPMMNVMMSRTSWSQAFEQVKVSAGPHADKRVLRSDDKRPLLLIHSAYLPLNRDEEYLLASSQKLGTLEGNDIYLLRADELLRKESLQAKKYRQTAMTMEVGDSCFSYTGPWHVAHFDTGTSQDVLFGTGAARAIEGITEIVFEAPLTPMYDSQEYEFSAWMLVSDKDYKIGRFVICLYDEQDSLISSTKVLTQEAVDNHGLWLRAARYIKVPAVTRKIAVQLVNIIYPSYRALDELMIRPADAVIISKSSAGQKMVNNHVLRH